MAGNEPIEEAWLKNNKRETICTYNKTQLIQKKEKIKKK